MWVIKFLAPFLIFVKNINAVSDDLPKCCQFGEILQEFENSTYSCVADKSQRNAVFVTETNFIKNNPSGSCLEFSTDFFEIEFFGDKIIKKNQVLAPQFPKCCPIGYIYNIAKHSCDPKGNFQHNFIDKSFVKVGLPQCHLVIDSPLNSLANLPPSADDFCEDETSKGYIRRQCSEDASICEDFRCVKKCCPDGKSFVNGPYCTDSYTNGINLNFSKNVEDPTDPFVVVHNQTRCIGTFFIMPETRYIFNLLKNGQFQYWKNLSNSYAVENPTDPVGYCLEHSKRPTFTGFFIFNCLASSKPKVKFQYTKWPKILSCIFLALTILIYFLLGQTKKLFGKILINYCVATFFMFGLLTYAQFDQKPNDLPCQIVGFVLVFLSTVSFAWLNVMCFDIWLTFGSTKNSIGVYQRKRDLKKLLIYTAYGWGMPLLLTLLIYILSISDSVAYSIRPYVGTSSCFIVQKPGNYAAFIFLRIPHLLIQIVNAFLFIKTILYCLRIKNEIQRINDNKNEKKVNFNQDKEKLFLIVKLAVIMGITFIVDTVSGFVDLNEFGAFWRNFEIVIDCFNCLQGVYIFIIFICKKSVYNDFLKKLHIKRRETYINNTTIDSFSSSTRISLKNSQKGNR